MTPLRAAAAVWLVAGAAPLFAQQDEAPGPIADNSFLIEEAFNQERGVVQHISTFARSDGGAWAYSFTQEWPLHGMRNQLSYTVPVRHDEADGTGVGDIGLNYRYQLVGLDGGQIYVAPRVTLLLPTGNQGRGRGAGGAGFQANLPVSVLPAPQIALHANAGATWTPSAKGPLGAESGTLDANAGGSAIWLVRPSFNLLVELLWYSTESVVAPNTEVRQDTWLVNPGVRWAFNFASGLQIVPGLAYTIDLENADGGNGWFLYLSFEHPFARTSP